MTESTRQVFLKLFNVWLFLQGYIHHMNVGLVFEDGLPANTYHMDVTGEFLNKGIECDIKTREFKMYPSSLMVTLELMVEFDSRVL